MVFQIEGTRTDGENWENTLEALIYTIFHKAHQKVPGEQNRNPKWANQPYRGWGIWKMIKSLFYNGRHLFYLILGIQGSELCWKGAPSGWKSLELRNAQPRLGLSHISIFCIFPQIRWVSALGDTAPFGSFEISKPLQCNYYIILSPQPFPNYFEKTCRKWTVGEKLHRQHLWISMANACWAVVGNMSIYWFYLIDFFGCI